MEVTKIKRPFSVDVGQDKRTSVVCVLALKRLTKIRKRKESCLTSGVDCGAVKSNVYFEN